MFHRAGVLPDIHKSPTMTRCCFDLFHGDPLAGATFADDVPLFRNALEAGWVAMFHKLTQGAGFSDQLGAGRLHAAVQAGLSVGGYHFMTQTDSVSSQVANFMRGVGRAPSPLLLCLDFEPIDASGTAEKMASQFVNAIRMATGKWPVLYTGRWDIDPIPLDNLPACPLWLSEYGTNPVLPATFKSWFLHQYSDGTVGPEPVDIPGIGLVDQSEFEGSTADLVRQWAMLAAS